MGTISRRKQIPVDDIVGTAEIAERCGWGSTAAAANWARRYEDFPSPVATLTCGALYDWREVKSWAGQTGHFKVEEA